MKKIGEAIVKKKWFIIILTMILLIPALIGYVKTDINYDILVYLPSDIETIKGENILTDDFQMGSFAMVVAEGLPSKEVIKLEEK